MIVVIGALRLRGSGADADAAGLAASIATAAAGEGSGVEVIARIGDDPPGDAVMLALARHGVGHVAVLRDPARATRVAVADTDERPDIETAESERTDGPPAADAPPLEPVLEGPDANLALRYLPQLGVIVAVHATPDVLSEAVAAASWAETALIVVVPAGATVPEGLPASAVTLEIDDADDSAAGAAVGRYAAALDRGVPAREAYHALLATMTG
ncbi:MAG TPA: hypothetical protein VIB02_03940 [Candidatus Limnocylindrales bacterium]|jgi:hypothetical protein